MVRNFANAHRIPMARQSESRYRKILPIGLSEKIDTTVKPAQIKGFFGFNKIPIKLSPISDKLDRMIPKFCGLL